MAGRPRKPPALHVVQGTMDAEQKRRVKSSPKAVLKLLEPPEHLDGDEKAAWRQLATKLHAMRITTDEDRHALEILVVAWCQAQRLRDFFRKLKKTDPDNVLTYVTFNEAKGIRLVRPRPQVGMLNVLDAKVLGLMSRFGLTPADRTRVKDLGLMPLGDDGAQDPDAEFTG